MRLLHICRTVFIIPLWFNRETTEEVSFFALLLMPNPLASGAYYYCVVHPRLLQGGLKTKRLSLLIAPLRGESIRRGLGDTYRLVGLRELRLGRNMGVAVALKVICYDY